MNNFSIVIPVHNEVENIPILASEIELALNSLDCEWECIWVDDGSTDLSWNELKILGPLHKGIKLSRNFGQSSAIMAGCDLAKFDLIVTLDSDLQNDPRDIPRILEALNSNLDCVCGIRRNRKDHLISRKIPSKIANKLAQYVTGIRITDLGCTLKVFRKYLISDSRLIGDMHRVLPVYFHMSGAKLSEIDVNHRERRFGKSKYGLNRIFKFIADILLAKVMNKISTRPLYLFGSIALMLLLTGLVSFILFIIKMFDSDNYLYSSQVEIDLATFCAVFVFGSINIVLLGLLAEVIIRKSDNSIELIKFNVIEETN